jgi:hypothetical protein
MSESFVPSQHNGSDASAVIRTHAVPMTAGARKAKAHGYRLRAEELRVISEDVILRDTQQTLRGLAATYEHLAATLEAATAP